MRTRQQVGPVPVEVHAFSCNVSVDSVCRCTPSPPASDIGLRSQEEAAEGTIEQLSRDRDPIMRYGAMYAIGMAYCGTSNNNAIRRLLHVAVSDVSDDVRLAAVTCLGFVLFRTPEQVQACSINMHTYISRSASMLVQPRGTSRVTRYTLSQLMRSAVVALSCTAL